MDVFYPEFNQGFYSFVHNLNGMVSNSKIIFVSSVAIILASASGIPSTIPLLSQSPVAEAQELSGDITAASGSNPFGGERMGTVTLDSDGNMTNITADFNDSPGEGNVFEGWLVDAGGSGYKLSLGAFSNGTLNFTQNMVNPYTYKNFEVTEEPAEDPDPNAATSIAGLELDNPFGQ
jgi:anti-sigma-K factor RskA